MKNLDYDDMKYLQVEVENQVLVVTIHRSNVANAINKDILYELRKVFTVAENNEEIQGIIITGEKTYFAAGADISEMFACNKTNVQEYIEYAHTTFHQIEHIAKPVIAAINGLTFGGGCELALCCDIRIATETAVFAFPEVTLGIIPSFGGTQRLTRLIGVGRAKEMIFTGKQIDAYKAQNYGLVNEVVPDGMALNQAKKLMEIILSASKFAVRCGKLAIHEGINDNFTKGICLEKQLAAECFCSSDKNNRMEEFLKKNKS